MCDEWEECLCEGGLHTSGPRLDEFMIVIANHLSTVCLEYDRGISNNYDKLIIIIIA